MTQANPGQYDQQFAAIQGQMLRMQQSLTALRVEMDLHKAGQAPALPVEFRSQFGEDVVAWNLFGGKSDGFFI